MPREMSVSEVGKYYELKRDQWRGNVAKISKDPKLLDEIKQYTWTYNEGTHPYLVNSRLNMTLHKFVMTFVYGDENINKLLDAGNIIEHLDNDGLNCTYENLHILSDDLNKAKAFSIDKMTKDSELDPSPSYILDVYYLHEKKQFQLQIYMNDDIFSNEVGQPLEMFICMYNSFDDLFVDWYYLLANRSNNTFERSKLHAAELHERARPDLKDVTPEEMNRPFIERNGEIYLNLSAKADGVPVSIVRHTTMREIEIANEE